MKDEKEYIIPITDEIYEQIPIAYSITKKEHNEEINDLINTFISELWELYHLLDFTSEIDKRLYKDFIKRQRKKLRR